MPALLLVAGYVARKGMEKSTCVSCKEIFGSTEKPLNLDINMEHFAYFDSINGGGLIYPTNFLFNIYYFVYCIFNSCISQLLEGKFLSVCNQNHTLVATIEKYLTNNDKYAGMFLSFDDCDKEWSIMIHKALVCFSNILLSEYCSVQTDKVSTAKIAREISKF